jgi:hypothetical protein
MKSTEKHLQELSEIRNLMVKSSRFLSLSGLSGISAGIIALAGALVAWIYLRSGDIHYDEYYRVLGEKSDVNILGFLAVDAIIILVLAITSGLFFSSRRARKMGVPLWNSASKLLLINLIIPLVTGGIVCVILLFQQGVNLIAPLTLIFYGLALINAGKFTQYNINYLGITEILTGLTAMIFINHSLFFWAMGFGTWHIIYGSVLYFRYERTEKTA